ncbi:HNH endonuclease [Wolbachia pipientis]|nr:HNH endonuclease [Wolbachia pipientis]
MEIHHKDRNRRNNMIKNLSLLHGHCHDKLHRRCA